MPQNVFFAYLVKVAKLHYSEKTRSYSVQKRMVAVRRLEAVRTHVRGRGVRTYVRKTLRQNLETDSDVANIFVCNSKT